MDYQTVRKVIDSYGLSDFGKATIREVVAISTQLEQMTNTEFIHMEMGVPGLKPARVGVEAEIEALRNGIASIYPNINGIPEVKEQASRFIKAFIDIDIAPECCVQCKEHSPLSSPADNATRRRIRSCLSIQDSRCRNNRSRSWDINTPRSTYTTTGETN